MLQAELVDLRELREIDAGPEQEDGVNCVGHGTCGYICHGYTCGNDCIGEVCGTDCQGYGCGTGCYGVEC